MRFIPARAGNRNNSVKPRSCGVLQVHPRASGEQTRHSRSLTGYHAAGSSPRERGTAALRMSSKRPRSKRFIPARAGNSSSETRCYNARRRRFIPARAGNSLDDIRPPCHNPDRFIPARAGNSRWGER